MIGTITSMWSPASVLSFSGIVYLVFCILAVVCLRFKGWCNLWGFLFFGVCWLAINQVNIYTLESQPSGYQPMVMMDGEWKYVQVLLGDDIDPPEESEWVYAMHVENSEFYHLPHYIWHPACLFYCPFIVIFLTFVVWLFI